MKGDDKAQIEAKTKALQQAAQSLYAAASAGPGGPEAVAEQAQAARRPTMWSTPSSPRSRTTTRSNRVDPRSPAGCGSLPALQPADRRSSAGGLLWQSVTGT